MAKQKKSKMAPHIEVKWDMLKCGFCSAELDTTKRHIFEIEDFTKTHSKCVEKKFLAPWLHEGEPELTGVKAKFIGR